MALPLINSTISLDSSGVILSSIIISALASIASSTCSLVSVSISILVVKDEFFFARATASFMPPAAAI